MTTLCSQSTTICDFLLNISKVLTLRFVSVFGNTFLKRRLTKVTRPMSMPGQRLKIISLLKHFRSVPGKETTFVALKAQRTLFP